MTQNETTAKKHQRSSIRSRVSRAEAAKRRVSRIKATDDVRLANTRVRIGGNEYRLSSAAFMAAVSAENPVWLSFVTSKGDTIEIETTRTDVCALSEALYDLAALAVLDDLRAA